MVIKFIRSLIWTPQLSFLGVGEGAVAHSMSNVDGADSHNAGPLLYLLSTSSEGIFNRKVSLIPLPRLVTAPVLSQTSSEPQWLVTRDLTFSEKLLFTLNLNLVLALGLLKLSVLLLYRRIFCARNSQGIFDISIRVMIWVTILWTLSFFFACLFSCGLKFGAAWGSTNEMIQYCVNMTRFGLGFAGSDFGSDIMISVMPLPMVGHLLATHNAG